MEIIPVIIQILVTVFGSLVALLSIPVLFRLHWPSPFLWIIKLLGSGLSKLFFIIGILSTIIGLTTGSFYIIIIGVYITIFFLTHIYKITRPPSVLCSLEKAFGLDWESNIHTEQKRYFLQSRTITRLPSVPIPRFEQNISFAYIPETDRKLLCDVWQPNKTIISSGLAFIYLHGSAWSLLDKDLGTRPFFNHLAAQGYVIMDVAYRLGFETDMMGMVNDVKRAIVWMKENASIYGVNPFKIVVSGGSAGAHLAMLAAYTSNNMQFTPIELEGKDVSVCGVVSLYGPSDLKAMYYHTNQQFSTHIRSGFAKTRAGVQLPKWIIKKMGKAYYRLHFNKDFANAGVFAILLGGHPEECPEKYALFSPITHVHTHCPSTLLIQGEHDLMVPVNATRILHTCLLEKKVPAVMHILPQTDHAFDLVFPRFSPSAHTAIYEVERFLALQITKQ